jgi:hypothetical protein
MGGTRNLTAISTTMRGEFNNQILKGETIGNSYKKAITGLSINPSDDYLLSSRKNQILLGDPSLKLYVPSAPKVEPANYKIIRGNDPKSEILQIKIPNDIYIEEVSRPQLDEWKWSAKLFVASSPGIYPLTFWSGKYDSMKHYFLVDHRTKNNVIKIEPLEQLPSPLGMVDTYAVDTNQDSTKNIIWNTQVIDFNAETSAVNKIDTVSFKITYNEEIVEIVSTTEPPVIPSIVPTPVEQIATEQVSKKPKLTPKPSKPVTKKPKATITHKKPKATQKPVQTTALQTAPIQPQSTGSTEGDLLDQITSLLKKLLSIFG